LLLLVDDQHAAAAFDQFRAATSPAIPHPPRDVGV
jgi:hypothetical protein